VKDWLATLDADERDLVSEEQQPEWTSPMLATLTHEHFSDPDWLFERKLDGERALIFKDGDKVQLFTRNRKSINDTYPELVEALERQAAERFVADGEIVAFKGDVTSFARLQQRLQIKDPDEARASGVAVHLYLFDLLHLDGWALEKLPLRRRKALLRSAIDFAEPIRFTAHRNESGEAYLSEACEKGWEGLIAKRADAPYQHSRSRDWLKFKCQSGQELVIGGFTEPKGSREGFGALLVGYYADGELRYAGKVGTGFDDALLRDLRERMDGIKRQTSPFAEAVEEPDVTWVTPELVGEFGFTEWTRSGKLRHPRFLGLRRDKAAEEVRRERPEGDG
jgi:bifunctional non-homologous end joining protein LigD